MPEMASSARDRVGWNLKKTSNAYPPMSIKPMLIRMMSPRMLEPSSREMAPSVCG